MKIVEITGTEIKFDNGNTITYDHIQDCCEYNYADFLYLCDESDVEGYDFEPPLWFERVEGAGFRFGNRDKRMFFVPCYSEQNGYYNDEVDIYYNGHLAIEGLQCDDSKMY